MPERCFSPDQCERAHVWPDRVRSAHPTLEDRHRSENAVALLLGRVANRIHFMVDGHAILIVAAGDAKIDNPKYKAQFGTKAKMLTTDEAETLIGHAVGGVCPFGINEGVAVYLDNSLKRFETVFPACGSSNSAIELSIEELERYSGYTAWIDVCKGWNE